MFLLYLVESNVVMRARGSLPLMYKAGEELTPCVDESVITMFVLYLGEIIIVM